MASCSCRDSLAVSLAITEKYFEALTSEHAYRRFRLADKVYSNSLDWSLDDILKFAASRNAIPADEFLMHFSVESLPIQKFKIFMTTKRLVQFAVHCVHMISDATYNLIVGKFPCITIGTTDRDKKFHPFELGICSHESTENFALVFGFVKLSKDNYFSRLQSNYSNSRQFSSNKKCI